ncbi:hypothetical protein [Streptomyces sp. NPDC002133]|uniref:hypothetical protein n=1 Tax=Streptomyces sp. NPDC002133 TaxID=3154409 RepID=UPI0033180729
MILSDWASSVIAREFDEGRRAALVSAVSSLDESVFGGQDLDRIAGAIIILFKRGVAIETIVDAAKRDWRNLLMGAGLGKPDWPSVLADRLGAPPES